MTPLVTKAIVLAGGNGTRLHPLTLAVSKQLLPVYNKPMVLYPIDLLYSVGIRDFLLITTPRDAAAFRRVLNGALPSWRSNLIQYAEQPEAKGIAEALIIGEDFIGDDRFAMILGDNLFLDSKWNRVFQADTPFYRSLHAAKSRASGATVFLKQVLNPGRYGVAEFYSGTTAIRSIVEKPKYTRSNWAVSGLYVYDHQSIEFAKDLSPSARGEIEITDVNNAYRQLGKLHAELLGDDVAWFDCGTPDALLDASNYVRALRAKAI